MCKHTHARSVQSCNHLKLLAVQCFRLFIKAVQLLCLQACLQERSLDCPSLSLIQHTLSITQQTPHGNTSFALQISTVHNLHNSQSLHFYAGQFGHFNTKQGYILKCTSFSHSDLQSKLGGVLTL